MGCRQGVDVPHLGRRDGPHRPPVRIGPLPGWPGQAPSYALGQRVWQQARDNYLHLNPGGSLKDFHRKALALGGVSLDVLRSELT